MSRDSAFAISDLPWELRRQIWLEALHPPTHRIFRFTFRYPKRGIWHDIIDGHAVLVDDVRAGDGFFLQPHCTSDAATVEECYQQIKSLVLGLDTQLRLSRVCREARAAVLARYPSSLPFRLAPHDWMRLADCDEEPAATDFPEHFLRFNTDLDIFVFDAFTSIRESILSINNWLGLGEKDRLLGQMRHVGIYDDACRFRVFSREPMRVELPPFGRVLDLRSAFGWCPCLTDECRNHCRRDNLPGFLALFPKLTTLYIASLSGEHEQLYDMLPRTLTDRNSLCPMTICSFCVAPEQVPLNDASLLRTHSMPTHPWPTARNTDFPGACIIYDNHTACPTLTETPSRAMSTRGAFWRRAWPYCNAVSHLELRFIGHMPTSDDVY
jgi:hypothetical protein